MRPLEAPHHEIDRRTILKAAAWATPVVALAAAVPMAAASTEEPDATFAQVLWDSVAPSGVTTQFQIHGRVIVDGTIEPGVLPSGTTIKFTPPMGAHVTVSAVIGGEAIADSDDTVTVYLEDGITQGIVYVAVTGTGTATAVSTLPGFPETADIITTSQIVI